MKVKTKLDLQAIKNLALEHGEKVAFAVVGLVFLLFVYSALKRESLSADKQPEQLQAKAGQVQSHVSQSTFDAKTANIAVVDYVDRAKREQINLGPYKPPKALNEPIFDQKAKRDNPTIYPLEELRADAGFGMFAITGAAADAGKAQGGAQAVGAGFAPGADATIVGRGYTVVTGLVPYKKQWQNYSQLFDAAQAADPSRDRPQFVRLMVERAEIDPAQPDKLDWKPVPDAKDFADRFAGIMGDVVPPKYRQDEIVAALGPLVRRPWGEAVNHPRIAAAIAQAGDAVDAGNQPQQARAPGGNAALEQMMNNAAKRGGGAAKTPVVTQPESDVEYRLCRFFDYAVAPKKQYRYRAKAVLHNPNFGVPPQFLAKPETNTAETLETEWSKPTGAVTVPDRYGVLARSVGEKWHRDEPSVKLLATAIDEKAGIEAGTDVDVYRASVVNLTAPKVEAIDPRDNSVRTLENVDLNTGIVVVDIHGGGPLSKKIGATVTGPVEVLVMDAQGNLRVRSELEDHAAIDLLVPEKLEEPAKKKDDKKEDPLDDRKAKGKKSMDDRLKGMPPPPGKAKSR
jgi:hypothetical protein